MGLELYMVGLVTKNIDVSRAFYERLGLDVPENRDDAFLGFKMNSGITFFLITPERMQIPDTNAVILEYYLPDRDAVEAKYAQLVAAGAPGYRAPFETSFGMYFAMVKDPDGHIVLLSAS